MRLKKIKLAGFKSFVEPTVIEIASVLVGVVGPNGCGKSNIIDAVRWVMGESSAKNLRGDSMADVIFSGSSSRKPVGRASVELVFDNSDGTASGPYAKYSEISIRREVARDGQSDYFLNKTKCRRKDITDLFLGTGLGPRAYSIIEQGMVTRIIEGRPEDLRAFVEEAAGVSRYKDRRRDTENRIRHTKENLERLEDIRQELGTQLRRLKRQSRAAARYKDLKQEERLVHAQSLALRWLALGEHIAKEQATLSKLETGMEAERAGQREIEVEIERLRQQQTESTDRFNEVQGEFYRVGAEIATVEQAIDHARESYQQKQHERAQLDQALQEVRRHLDTDRARVKALEREIAGSSPRLEQATQSLREAGEELARAEHAMQTWQTRWEGFGQDASQPGKERDVQKARIRQLEQNVDRLQSRQSRLQHESDSLTREIGDQDLQVLRDRAVELERGCEINEGALEELESRILSVRKEIEETGVELEAISGRRQGVDARLASLKERQEAAVAGEDEVLADWLRSRGLDKAPRLAAALEVAPGWERAVDRVLGKAVSAVCVPAIEVLAAELGELSDSALFLVEEGGSPPVSAGGGQVLLDKIRCNRVDLSGLLAGIYAVEGLDEAMAMRAGLAADEIIVTRLGVLVARNWLSLVDQRGSDSGVLARTRAIEQLSTEADGLGRDLEVLRERLGRSQEVLESLELDRSENRREMRALTQERTGVQNQLGRQEAQWTQCEARRKQVAGELGELREQLQRDEGELANARQALREAEARVGEFDARRTELQEERARLIAWLGRARTAVNEARDGRHREELKHQELQTSLDSAGESITRLQAQVKGFASRSGELDRILAQGEKPEEELKNRLAALLRSKEQAGARLKEARRVITDLDEAVRTREHERARQEQKTEEARELLEQGRVARKELLVRRETLEEQIRQGGFEPARLGEELPEEANESEWHTRLEGLERKINRIGPVNLVAIEEYEEQSERKNYLDKQNEDLSQALATLEGAIRKIDRETRTRFKETFDRINTGFQDYFPRLFGGGHAYLELGDDDLLTSGVIVMARPPGKRNSTIHLLSGGEKALTAVALLFAFFELNPAPFCLLDEVDAPLDDTNVERYCETLRTLSQRSQMIFVTHNKLSMESADILIGVTMSEPGVSRLVTVDVVQAVELAAQ